MPPLESTAPARIARHRGASASEPALCSCSTLHEEGIAAAAAALPGERLTAGLAELFRVFGDPTRLRILTALAASELCVCDLAAALGSSQSAISHQLALLRASRLVKSRREGKVVFYSLDDDHVGSILGIGLEHASEQIVLKGGGAS